ncbi:MAG: hypothetical protein Kow0013_14800 [Pararhodobacter sp.]
MGQARNDAGSSGAFSTIARGAGRVSVIAGGVALLAISAQVAHRWLPDAGHQTPAHGVTTVHDGPAPQIWLGSLVMPGGDRHAEADVILPRSAPVRPPLPPRADPAAAAPATPPAAVQIARAAPRPVLPHDPAARTAPATGPALIAPQVAVAALRAPTRSLVPRRRPVVGTLVASVETAEAETAEAAPQEPGTQITALARSLTPQRRPDTVTRLASLALETPPVSVPQPSAAPLAIPALPRAQQRADACESRLTRDIPRRRGGADDGSAVIARLAGVTGRARDDAIVAEVMAGNIPDHLRTLVPVTFTGTGPGGRETRVTICVMPDYLAVGSDRDFVRVPMGLPAAMRVAERFDMVLPTTRMVDAIYQQASLRLAPSPMTPGPQMESTGYFQRHNATVQGQMARAGGRLGQLVAGHKKDLVLTNRLERNPGQVAIYGWHRPNGRPIQPLSTVHGAQYADYSHGIRLVSRRAYVNGQAVDLRDLLSDGRYAGLVSSEGPITNRTLLAALR